MTKASKTAVDTEPVASGVGGMAVSMQTVLVVALAVVAAGLRLVRLDWLPLDHAEAALALPAWRAAGAMPVPALPPPPLLFHLERLVFWLFGGGDAAARLVPALAGVALVLLAPRLWPVMGRSAAVAAAALLALSPLWVFFGRQLSGATLSTLAVLTVLGALAGRGHWDRDLVPAAAALAVAAGGLNVALVVAVLVYGLLTAIRGDLPAHVAAARALWPASADQRRAAVVFAAVLVLAASGLLMRLDGLAALLEAPRAWALPPGGVAGPIGAGFLLPLAVYAPLTLAFGLVGAVLAARGGGRPGTFLAVWLAMGLAWGSLIDSPVAIAAALLPLTLAAAVALAWLASRVVGGFGWGEDGAMIGILMTVLAFALIQAFAYADAGDSTASGSGTLILGSLLLAGLLVAVYAILWGCDLAIRVVGVTAVVALSLLGWANGSRLCYQSGDALRELLRPRYITADASRLAGSLADASWAATKDPNALSAVVDPALEPVLAWSLRDRRNLRWARPVSDSSEGAVVVSPVDTPEAFGQAAYLGQSYAVAAEWHIDIVGDAQDLLRWLLQRRPPASTSGDRDFLFEKADLYIRAD